MKSKLIGSLFVVLTLVVGIMAFAPSAFADTSVTMTKGASSGQDCVAANNCFDPANAQVEVGEHVTWTNADTASHTVTSGKSTDNVTGTVFDSGLVKAGATFSFQFPNAGTFNYYCQVHPWMTGVVTVVAAGEETMSTQQTSSNQTMQSTPTQQAVSNPAGQGQQGEIPSSASYSNPQPSTDQGMGMGWAVGLVTAAVVSGIGIFTAVRKH